VARFERAPYLCMCASECARRHLVRSTAGLLTLVLADARRSFASLTLLEAAPCLRLPTSLVSSTPAHWLERL